jgi:hypothetical protein
VILRTHRAARALLPSRRLSTEDGREIMTTKSDDLEPTVRLPRVPVELEDADPDRTLVREDHSPTMVREALRVPGKKG